MALEQGGAPSALEVSTPRIDQRAATTLRRFAQAKPLGMAGAVVLALMGMITVLAPLIAPYDPLDASFSRSLPVSGEHWLGTDPLGRDVFSRVIMGSRISIYVGIVSVFIGVSLGAFIGIVSAYVGGVLDLVVQRFVDAIQAFPGLVLAMAIMVTLGQSINNVIIAIAILLIPGGARIIRGAALSIKEQTYIDSARAVGCSHVRIMARHIFPNTIAPYIILISVSIGNAIITEAALSFLGVGAPPDAPSWGAMVNTASQELFTGGLGLAVGPGLAIALAVFAFNLLGDALRDTLDPRLRQR